MQEESNKGKPKIRGQSITKKGNATHRLYARLNDEEYLKFKSRYLESEVDSYTLFIKACILNKPIHIIKVDKNEFDYCKMLTKFYNEFKAFGNNYNQVVRTLKSNFGEKKALALLYKLEKITTELALLSKMIIELTQKLENKWLQK